MHSIIWFGDWAEKLANNHGLNDTGQNAYYQNNVQCFLVDYLHTQTSTIFFLITTIELWPLMLVGTAYWVSMSSVRKESAFGIARRNPAQFHSCNQVAVVAVTVAVVPVATIVSVIVLAVVPG